jgi:hypothetical protein
LDLYGHVYAGDNLAYGEVRFHTLPQKLPPAATAKLQASGPVAFRQVAYEIVPLTSSPCDLHALAVLAIRTLMVDEENSLSVALDEVLSLARQIKVDHNPSVPLGARIQAIFERDARWLKTLGPQHLTREAWKAEEALNLITNSLWFDTLGAVLAMLPDRGPDSFCRDFGDVPDQALETVFDRPLEQWNNLVVRSRSLLFLDWRWNREIGQTLRQFLEPAGEI